MSDISTTGKMLPEYNSGLATSQTLKQQTAMINNISGHNGVEIIIDWNRAIRIALEEYYPESMWAFGVEMIADNQIRVYAGSVRIHGVVSASVAETDVTLTSNTEYVYVYYDKSTKPATGSILKTASVPVSTTGALKVPLCRLTADGDVWSIAKRYHRGDVNLDTPMTG